MPPPRQSNALLAPSQGVGGDPVSDQDLIPPPPRPPPAPPSALPQPSAQPSEDGQAQPPPTVGDTIAATAARLAGASSRQIAPFLRQTGQTLDPTQSNWCAAYVNGVLGANGVQGTTGPGRNIATGFLNWGVPADGEPQPGDVMVLPRGHSAGGLGGHVGIAMGQVAEGKAGTFYLMQSGNMGDKVQYHLGAGGQCRGASRAITETTGWPIMADAIDDYLAGKSDTAPPATAPASSTPQKMDAVDAYLTGKDSPVDPKIDPITRRPWQYATSASGPVAASMGTPIREDQLPGVGVQAAGSMASDLEQRRRIVAAQLFPKLDPLEAQSHVFFGPNGRMAAVGPDGKAFYVDPTPYAPDVNQPRSLIPDNPLARAGTYAGPALPAVGAVAGGAVGGPTSVVYGPVGAAAGAAAGDVARQTIARSLDPGVPGAPGNPLTPVPYNWRQTIAEAAGAGAGQFAGGLLMRGVTPNPLGASAYDLRTLQDPVVQQRIADAYARAGAQGITLTPGQASGLSSVINLEDVYASGSAGPRAANTAQEFYAGQRPQVVAAFDRAAGNVSPVADKTDAALQFQQGQEDAQRIVRQQANAAARPSYQAAQAAGQVMSPDLAQLIDAPAVKTAMNAARTEYANLYRKAAPDTPDFALWDLTKRKLDDAQTVAKRAGENTTASSIDSLRSDLLTHLDTAYPSYATARATAAPGQRLAARLESSTGSAAGDGTERARAIVAPVFESNNPRAIAEARDAFNQAGRGAEWDAGTRAYMQDVFDATTKSQEGLNPSMLRRQLWSDPNKREAMRAAMDPVAFKGLENFMGTLEDVARSKGMNSLTAPRQATANALMEAAGNTGGVKTIGFLKSITSPLRLADALGQTGDAIQRWMIKRNVDRIGEYLFSQNGQQYLRDMGRLPRGAQAMTATARFLGQQGGLAVAPANSDQSNALLRAVP